MSKFIEVNILSMNKYVPKSLDYLEGAERNKVAKRLKLIKPAVINIEDISAIIPYTYTYDNEKLENTEISVFQIILKIIPENMSDILIDKEEYEKINKELLKYGHNEKI